MRIPMPPAPSTSSIASFALIALVAGLAGCSQTSSQPPIPTVGLQSPPAPVPAMRPAAQPYAGPSYSWNGEPSRMTTGALPQSGPPASDGLQWHASPRGAPVAEPAPYRTQAGTIEVRPGDTLYGIARSRGTTVAAIVDANRLSDVTLHPGQRLMLPAEAR